jgi:hypothetical protein
MNAWLTENVLNLSQDRSENNAVSRAAPDVLRGLSLVESKGSWPAGTLNIHGDNVMETLPIICGQISEPPVQFDNPS